MLDRHDAARSRGRRRLLRRPVRVGARGRHAAGRRPASTTSPGSRGGDVAAVGSPAEGAPRRAAWNTYVWVEDADETAAKVRAAGGTVLMEPVRRRRLGPHGDLRRPGRRRRSASGSRSEHRGAAVVNEPGSLNFNDLNTRDLDGAAAFYGAVFGWELLDVGGASMWALPAYGDFLERRTPGHAREHGARWARRSASRRWSRASIPIPRRPARHAGALGRDVRASTTPTRSPRGRPSSAAGWSCRRSTRRGCG